MQAIGDCLSSAGRYRSSASWPSGQCRPKLKEHTVVSRTIEVVCILSSSKKLCSTERHDSFRLGTQTTQLCWGVEVEKNARRLPVENTKNPKMWVCMRGEKLLWWKGAECGRRSRIDSGVTDEGRVYGDAEGTKNQSERLQCWPSFRYAGRTSSSIGGPVGSRYTSMVFTRCAAHDLRGGKGHGVLVTHAARLFVIIILSCARGASAICWQCRV